MLEIFTEEELEEMRQKYEERERKEQFEMGEKHGKEIGEKVGEERGERKTAEDVAGKMRKKGFDISLIMELTGLSRDKILTL